MDPNSLREWSKNPKQHDTANVQTLARSLRRFGFVAPVVVWGSQKQIVAGHGRCRAALLILKADPGAYLAIDAPGPGLIPVRVVEFASASEADMYAIQDNRSTESNPMDPAAIAEILRELDAAGEEIEIPAYSDAEIASMLAPPPDAGEWGGAMEALPDQDRAPIQQMTFTLHDDQAETIRRAMERARALGPFVDTGNENSNGNALARVAEMFLGAHP
jgi:hypothetical protein